MCFGKGGDCPLCHFMERERHHGRLPRLAKDATSSDVGTAPAELDGPQPIKYRASLGQRSLHAGAAGRIFLAFLTPEERRQGGHRWRCYGVGPGIRLRRTSRRVGRCPRCPRSPFARRAPSLRRPPSRGNPRHSELGTLGSARGPADTQAHPSRVNPSALRASTAAVAR